MKAVENGIKINSKIVDSDGEIYLIELIGYLDQSNASVLEKIINDTYESECYKVIFDMKEVSYISSAGWGVFVGEIARFRVKGGDFKLIRMNPEVYQVYTLLEFYHIFEDYETLDEALESFGITPGDRSSGVKKDEKLRKIKISEEIEFSKSLDEHNENGEKRSRNKHKEKSRDYGENKKKPQTKSKEGVKAGIQGEVLGGKNIRVKNQKHTLKPSGNGNDDIFILPQKAIPLKELSLQEKIKKICGEYPLFGLFKIKRMLSHEEFGNVKISIFKLYKILKELNLDTKTKRYRYYRSV